MKKKKTMAKYSVGYWVGLYFGLFYCLMLSIIIKPLTWREILLGIITFSAMGAIVRIMGGYNE